MNREFLDLYNRELALLREHAAEFAEEYPGVAERLGGLVGERVDPMIGGLLEGAAFLAARVQLKLKHEFGEFTTNLLEELVPHYLAPTPSAMLARVKPPFDDPALRDGRTIARGAYLDATYRERDRNIACRFRLTSDITLWSLDINSAEYYPAPGPLRALGVPVGSDAAAGLRLTLTLRTTRDPAAEPAEDTADRRAEQRLSGVKAKNLTVHLLGAEADAVALYEQLFAHTRGIWFRRPDKFGDSVVMRAPEGMLAQIGFGERDSLLPNDLHLFRGFDLVREYFTFPRKFLGFRLEKLGEMLARTPSKSVDVIFVFDEVAARLASAVRADMFALYAAPAVNLFEKTLDRIPVKPSEHEFHVLPDRSRPLDFEPNSLIEVNAHLVGESTKVPVLPLYTTGSVGGTTASPFTYTIRRLPRRRSAEERKYGRASDYTGTEMFIAIGEPARTDGASPVAELSVRALCTNRHLTEHLPVGESGADFRFLDDTKLDIVCIAGPTPPHEPVVTAVHGKAETASAGEVAWRLINMLSLNHLGLVEHGAGRDARALRETLALFANLSSTAVERRIRGLRNVEAKPIVRRVARGAGVGAARGLEVTVTLDEKAFEGSGAFLLGAVLDRFFAEYVGVNHFTETAIRSAERGEIMRWPPRAGARGQL